ncbi:MAG TPA: hypothetical protein ENJ01_00965 [Gammaproteobacteria bacterium]|nr:hypothetical protein [Gammaproteobacteria bacterium]
MIIWTGRGFLIVVVAVLALAGVQAAGEAITGDVAYYQNNPWLIFVGMLVAATITWALNKTLLKSESKTVVDAETGEPLELVRDHALFFIAAKWWPAIFSGIGVIATVFRYMVT